MSASSAELADRWSNTVHFAIQSLLTMPDRGQPCVLLSPGLHDLRSIVIAGFERYSIYYRLKAETSSLTVVAVLHSSREVERILDAPRS